MYEAGQVENVGMRMVGEGESADWLEYVLGVGKAKKKKTDSWAPPCKLSFSRSEV